MGKIKISAWQFISKCVVSNMNSNTLIPIIDLGPICTGGPGHAQTEEWTSVAKQLESALTTVGFVYLVNHGIEPAAVVSAFDKSRSFFELPGPVKLQYIKGASAETGVAEFHGYAPPSKEILSPGVSAELRESFDIDRKVVAADKYPDAQVPGFESALLALEVQSRTLTMRMLKLLAVALGLDDIDYFVRASKNIQDPQVASYTAFRSNYYPPIENSEAIVQREDDGSVVRCGDHTDYGIITLLFQDSIGGLEIKPAGSTNWIAAPPIPGTVLMNTGDMLQFWSGGRFPATWHRVQLPKTALQRQCHRQSIVYFVFPDDETQISNLVEEDEDKHKTKSDQESQLVSISAYEYATDRILKSYKY